MDERERRPAGPGEKACFLCGVGFCVPFNPKERYPREACRACIAEAVDESGRGLRFENTTFAGGGFASVCADTGERGEVHECFIRGRRCRADEAYLGGIVVVPYPP